MSHSPSAASFNDPERGRCINMKTSKMLKLKIASQRDQSNVLCSSSNCREQFRLCGRLSDRRLSLRPSFNATPAVHHNSPLVDFRILLQPARLASKKTSIFVTSPCQWNTRMARGLPKKYLKRRINAFHTSSVGALMSRQSSLSRQCIPYFLGRRTNVSTNQCIPYLSRRPDQLQHNYL